MGSSMFSVHTDSMLNCHDSSSCGPFLDHVACHVYQLQVLVTQLSDFHLVGEEQRISASAVAAQSGDLPRSTHDIYVARHIPTCSPAYVT